RARHGWHGPRPGDRAACGRGARRRSRRGVARGRGLDLHAATAERGRPDRPGRSRGRLMTPDLARTVLIVEDEESFVDALTVGLAREGFRARAARSGAEALELFDALRPDVVLLDVMLPDVSGLDV